jgi:hypothetical protein
MKRTRVLVPDGADPSHPAGGAQPLWPAMSMQTTRARCHMSDEHQRTPTVLGSACSLRECIVISGVLMMPVICMAQVHTECW